MGKKIETIARGVIIDRSFVLLCRPVGESYTFLPGGHVEFFENSGEALVREIQEELGVSSKIQKYLGTYEHGFKSSKKHHEINLVFLLKSNLKYSKKVKSSEDHIEFFWQPIDKLEKVNFLPKGLGRTLKKWLKSEGTGWGSSLG